MIFPCELRGIITVEEFFRQSVVPNANGGVIPIVRGNLLSKAAFDDAVFERQDEAVVFRKRIEEYGIEPREEEGIDDSRADALAARGAPRRRSP